MSYPPPVVSSASTGGAFYQPPVRPAAPTPTSVPPNSFQDQLMRLEARLAHCEAENAELKQRLAEQEAEWQTRVARLEALVDQFSNLVPVNALTAASPARELHAEEQKEGEAPKFEVPKADFDVWFSGLARFSPSSLSNPDGSVVIREPTTFRIFTHKDTLDIYITDSNQVWWMIPASSKATTEHYCVFDNDGKPVTMVQSSPTETQISWFRGGEKVRVAKCKIKREYVRSKWDGNRTIVRATFEDDTKYKCTSVFATNKRKAELTTKKGAVIMNAHFSVEDFPGPLYGWIVKAEANHDATLPVSIVAIEIVQQVVNQRNKRNGLHSTPCPVQ